MAKKSFILYCDSSDVVKKLSKEQAGELMFILFDYANGEKIPPIKDIAIDIVFTQIKNQFDRDLEKYNAVVLKRKEAGLLSGKARRTKRTSVKSVEQKETKRTDSVSDNDNVSDIKKQFTPPTQLEVENYFIENNYKKEAGAKAWKYYNESNWKDSKGNKVKNWKQKMQGVWFKPENEIKTSSGGTVLQGYFE